MREFILLLEDIADVRPPRPPTQKQRIQALWRKVLEDQPPWVQIEILERRLERSQERRWREILQQL